MGLEESIEIATAELGDGEIMTVGEFIQGVIMGGFIDYDGYVQFITCEGNERRELKDIYYNIFFNEVYYNESYTCDIVSFCTMNNITEVIWYGR